MPNPGAEAVIAGLGEPPVGRLLGSNPTEPLPPEYPEPKAFFTVTFYYNENPPN